MVYAQEIGDDRVVTPVLQAMGRGEQEELFTTDLVLTSRDGSHQGGWTFSHFALRPARDGGAQQ